jgi:predicted ATPase
MHLRRINFSPERYPTTDAYPFNQRIFRETPSVTFDSPVTFFVGENGSGKTTLLKAICRRCGIHIWQPIARLRVQRNPYEELLCNYLSPEWINGPVPGSYFASDVFKEFADNLDEWAAADSGVLDYFGGASLVTQSHGQSLMAMFRARYCRRGLYLLDEPETALSPATQVELVRLFRDMATAGHAQFIVATHSPIIMSCPGAVIYGFDTVPIKSIEYESTEHYQVYKSFLADPTDYLDGPAE